jgi:hypothetical protein
LRQKRRRSAWRWRQTETSQPFDHRLPVLQRLPFQYWSQRSAYPLRTIAHERSPTPSALHQAAVRFLLPEPDEWQRIGLARTRIWWVGATPLGPPSSFTKWSLAAFPLALGQGWFGLQLPSISRAAMPESLILGPSAHQMGPSPSQTCVGVHVKDRPEATIEDRRAGIISLPFHAAATWSSS